MTRAELIYSVSPRRKETFKYVVGLIQLDITKATRAAKAIP